MRQTKAAEPIHYGFVLSGFFSLLVISFLDNSRGPLLPVLCEQLKIPYETAGTFLTLGCLAAVASMFGLGRLLQSYSERNVALGTALFSLLPGALAPWVEAPWSLLLLGILMGASVTLLGSMCNILTIKGSPSAVRGRILSFQQVMYGVGSFFAPLAFAALLRAGLPWWWMLIACSIGIFALALSFLVLLPEEKPLPRPEGLPKTRFGVDAYLMVAVFAIYVAGEVLASMWMSTLLVGAQGYTPEDAATQGMIFFILLGVSRFLCFLFVTPRMEAILLPLSLAAGLVFGLLGQQGHAWALGLIGLVGPFYPLAMSKISRDFPEDWKAMTVLVFVAIQSMLALMHQSVGSIADRLGIAQAFLLAPFFFALALGLLAWQARAARSRSAGDAAS